MSGHDLKFEVIGGREALRALEADWEALQTAGNHEPSTSFEWTDALLHSHVAGSDEVVTVIVRESGRAAAIVPMVMRLEKLAGIVPVTTLMPVSELYPTHSDILGDCGRAEVIGALWQALESLPGRWQMLRLRRVVESSMLARGLAGFLETAGLQHRARREFASYVIALQDGYPAYLASRSAKFRNYLKRRTRQLEGAGRIDVRLVGVDCDLEAGYRDLLAVEELSWKHAHGTAITAIPRQREFYRRLCEGALRRNRLHLTVMYLDERPIAFNLGYVQAGRYHYLKTSYDAALRRLGVATVFRAILLEMLAAENVQLVDFPGEPYEWEAQWTGVHRWNSSVLVFNDTMSGKACHGLVWMRDLAKKRASEGRIRHVNPRALGSPPIGEP